MTPTEREEYELAALAARIDPNQWFNDCDNCDSKSQWNPKTDPGDSLRLAVDLRLKTNTRTITSFVSNNGDPEITLMRFIKLTSG